MVAHQLCYITCLVAIIELQCQAFKHLSKKSILSGTLLRSHGCNSWRISSPLPSLYSIRGGSSENDGDDEYNDDDDNDTSFYDFISSFESELAEIRREAELEAENEMKKIRGLFERRDEVVDDDDDTKHEEEFIEPEYHCVTDGPNENDQYEVVHEDSDVPPEENFGASPDAEETNESTDDNGNVLYVDESINRQCIKHNDEGRKESDEELKDNTTDLQAIRDLISGISESVDATMDYTKKVDSSMDGSSEMIGSSSSSEKNSKSPKKKSKANKKRRKERVDLTVESKISKRGRVDNVGESVVVTRTRDSDDKVTQTFQSGIWNSLRSDLGRALCLFLATIIVAILTKRLERQMEADEAITRL